MLCVGMENLQSENNLDAMDNLLGNINNSMVNAASASRIHSIVNDEATHVEIPIFGNNQDLLNYIGNSVSKKN